MKLIENEYCELKSILTKDIKKEIIAFANTIINYLKEYNKINRNETEKLLNISKTRAYQILDELLKKNIIKKEDTGKNTYYVLR